jgi:hypothetical protein
LDLEATEMSIRSSMHAVGGTLLEKLLDSDNGYRGARVPCGHGHEADFIDYRSKSVLTVLSRVRVRRAYYHCNACQEGVVPKDSELDIVSTSLSPGVRRLMGRVGGKEAFAEGRADLKELAGIVVKTKQVERVSEAVGEQMEAISRRQCAASLSGRIVVLAKPVPKMYVAIDGTGVPMVAEATQIVDLYHAREHLCGLSKILYGPETPKAKGWSKTRIDELDAGRIEVVLAAMGRLRPTAASAQDELRKATEYFKTNAERMRYDHFRQQGLFVGSGVVEAGGKTVIGRRLKQSGMHWTLRGANAILALRCWDLSGRWEQFWEARAA